MTEAYTETSHRRGESSAEVPRLQENSRGYLCSILDARPPTLRHKDWLTSAPRREARSRSRAAQVLWRLGCHQLRGDNCLRQPLGI